MERCRMLAVKRMSDVLPGDLIRLRLGGNIGLCLVLDATDQAPDAKVALLQTAKSPKPLPFLITIPRTEYCVWLGGGWLFEPLLTSETYVGNQSARWGLGTVSIEEDGRWIMNIAAYDSFSHDGHHFDLVGRELTDGPSNFSAPVTNWRIWLSEEDRTRDGGQPLMQWPAQSKEGSASSDD